MKHTLAIPTGLLLSVARPLTPLTVNLTLALAVFASFKTSALAGPVPPVLPAPITYQTTELRWHEERDPDYGGLFVESINSRGLVVGWVTRPDGFRHGVINLGQAGQATDTMVDLNEVFAMSLTKLNRELQVLDPGVSGWRIFAARSINEAGLIACDLIPEANPRDNDQNVPVRLAVASLNLLGTGDAITRVDDQNAHPEQGVLQMNETGDLLTTEGVAFVEDEIINRYRNRLYRNTAPLGDTPIYLELPIDEVTEWRPTFNSSLQLASVNYGSITEPDALYRYSIPGGTEELFWEESNWPYSMSSSGVAEDGTVYLRSLKERRPYRLTSATDRTPLTDGDSSIGGYRIKVSRAQTSGDEEMLLKIEDGIEYQIYRPNFGRFVLPVPLEAKSVDGVSISPPHRSTSNEKYIGGYIALEKRGGIQRSFILTPEGATVPTIIPVLQITQIIIGSENRTVTLTWNSRPSHSYAVESSRSLSGQWLPLRQGLVSVGEKTTHTIPGVDLSPPKLFFRVREED